MKKIMLLACLVVLVLLTLSGCGKKNKFVGTWTVPGGNGGLVISTDGTGFFNNSYDNPTPITWEIEGSRLKMTDVGRAPKVAYGEINADGNMNFFDTATASTPVFVLTPQK